MKLLFYVVIQVWDELLLASARDQYWTIVSRTPTVKDGIHHSRDITLFLKHAIATGKWDNSTVSPRTPNRRVSVRPPNER